MTPPGAITRFIGAPRVASVLYVGVALIVLGWMGGAVPWWVGLIALANVGTVAKDARHVKSYDAWASEWRAMGGAPAAMKPAKRPASRGMLAAQSVAFAVMAWVIWNMMPPGQNISRWASPHVVPDDGRFGLVSLPVAGNSTCSPQNESNGQVPRQREGHDAGGRGGMDSAARFLFPFPRGGYAQAAGLLRSANCFGVAHVYCFRGMPAASANRWRIKITIEPGDRNEQTGRCRALHGGDGSRHSRCRFSVLQKPLLGTADREYWNRLGVRSVLLQIPEASMNKGTSPLCVPESPGGDGMVSGVKFDAQIPPPQRFCR